ncbi:MAG TPA: sigma-54 dependent transcriptional regulator [Pyrinomonadaceae bacterium]|jgi:DNA-binding NtrC family response regulator
MDQAFSLQLFNVGRGGQLYETLVAILNSSFEDRFSWQSVDDLDPESQDAFFKTLEVSTSLVVLLIFDRGNLPQAGGFIQGIKTRNSDAEIIVMTEESDARELFGPTKLGASDFIVPPVNVSTIVPLILKLLAKAERRQAATKSLKALVGMKLLVGQSPTFLAETSKIPLLASCDGRVLILGETGTGKELFARAIHYLSPRMGHPFVPVSCGALPVELLENEMFGHSKGAFTGATTSERGLIREAEGGTLFLDEVDTLPLLAQTKLLRFLQEGEYKPLGSSKSQYANARIIAASNINLAQAVKEGKLRQDLYYRLNIARIHLPPLRDRRDDVRLLAEHFLLKYAHQFDRNVRKLSEGAVQKLMFYDWPGNIRELENTIERAVMLSESECIEDTDVLLPENEVSEDGESFQQSKNRMIVQFERTYLQRLMVTHQGNVTQAARAAQKNRRAFWELIRKHNIDVRSFKAN